MGDRRVEQVAGAARVDVALLHHSGARAEQQQRAGLTTRAAEQQLDHSRRQRRPLGIDQRRREPRERCHQPGLPPVGLLGRVERVQPLGEVHADLHRLGDQLLLVEDLPVASALRPFVAVGLLGHAMVECVRLRGAGWKDRLTRAGLLQSRVDRFRDDAVGDGPAGRRVCPDDGALQHRGECLDHPSPRRCNRLDGG